MESDNSQNSEHNHEPVMDGATNSHQDINLETQHKRVMREEREAKSTRRTSSVLSEEDLTSASGVSSGGGRGEEQAERVNSPETVEQVQQNASTSDASPMFKPLPNSVLHTALESHATKEIKEPLFRPSPPSDDEDVIYITNDVISLHSTNSEVASDNDDAITVEDMISPDESLFTPPASSDDDTPLIYLVSSKSKKPTPRRQVMSHVQVPPLRRPKSDYQDLEDIFPPKPPKKKKKITHAQAHSSLLAALQSQFAHNHGIHDDEDRIVQKKPKKKIAQRNAVAGPSKLPPAPSNHPRPKARKKRQLIESSSSSDESAAGSSGRSDSDSKGKGLKAQRKRRKITIDLTLDEDNVGTRAASTARCFPARAASIISQPNSPSRSVRPSPIPAPAAVNYSSPIASPVSVRSVSFHRPSSDVSRRGSTPEPEGRQRLNLRFYQHPPPSILHVNTHFHRQWLHDTMGTDSVGSSLIQNQSATTDSRARRGASGALSSRFPWGGLQGGGGRSSRRYLGVDDGADVVSTGYVSLGVEDDDSDVDVEDAGADFPALKLERQPSVPPVVEDELRLVKIDLAAEFKKRKLAKGKQKQKRNSEVSLSSGFNRDQGRPDGSVVTATPRREPLKALFFVPSGGISLPSGSLPYPASHDPQPPPLPHPSSPSIFHPQSDDLQTYLMSSLPSSPTTALDEGFHAALPSAGGSGSLPYAIRRPHGNLGVFMHDYAALPSSPDSHAQIASGSLSNTTNLTSFSTTVDADGGADRLYSLSLQQGPSASDMPHFHQSDEILLRAATGTTVFDGGGLAALHDESWMTAGEQFVAEYGYDTVDPTLICGAFANEDDRDVNVASTSAERSGKNGRKRRKTRKGKARDLSYDDKEETSVVSPLSDTSKAGSLFSGTTATRSQSRYADSSSSSSSSSPTSSVAPLPTSLTSLDGSPSSQSSGFEPSKPSRLETPISLGPSNAVSEAPSRAFVARYESSPLSDLTSLSDDSSVATPEVTEPKPIIFPKARKLEVVIVRRPRGPAPGWEEETPDDDVYCHQCRSRSSHPKTRCACKAKYCARCVSVRPQYAAVLKIGGRVYSCPRCEEWCTCSACCRKRGETYVPLRARTTVSSPSPAVSLSIDNVSPRPSRPRKVRKLFLSPSATPSPLPHISEGSASPSLMPLPFASIDTVPSSQSTSQPPAQTPKKTTRVFIGKAQPYWGLGKKPRARELNPAPRAVWPENPTGPCTVRYYIGSRDFLQHRPMRLESTDDLLAGLTSIACLEDSDVEDADDATASQTCDDEETSLVNDEKSNRPLADLCQRDVAKAISATYESLGHTVILSEELCQ